MLHAMLLDFQSGDNHNHTSRIYEKVAGRVGLVQQNMQYTTAGGYATDSVYLADSGNSDKIYQTIDSIESEGDNFFEQPNPCSVDMLQHVGASNIMTVGLKLVSGLLQNERYIPLLALKGAGLTLELTLASAENCFFSASTDEGVGGLPTFTAAAPTYTVQNVEYIAQTIDFDEAFTATFMSMIQANGLIQFHGVSYHSFVWTWSYSTTATEVIPIALRARSLKAIIMGMRNNNILSNAAAFSIGHRTSANISQYVFSIGGVRIPQVSKG